MTTQQVVLYVLVAVIVLLYVRRWLTLRGMKQYSPHQVADLMRQAGTAVLLDVRTTAERQRQTIKGSLHIPLHELGRRTGELDKHRNKEVICYCQSGNRSLLAAAKLKKVGFRAANMKGGIAEWNSSGLR